MLTLRDNKVVNIQIQTDVTAESNLVDFFFFFLGTWEFSTSIFSVSEFHRASKLLSLKFMAVNIFIRFNFTFCMFAIIFRTNKTWIHCCHVMSLD